MQPKTPIVDAIRAYIDQGIIRFHMPGHKGSVRSANCFTALVGADVLKADVTNVPGMDDLHQPHGVIEEAEALAAEAFGADRTYFLINGSSCGLQALVMTVCNPGEKILVPRNIHRSVLSGIILSGAAPVYYLPEYFPEFGIPVGTTSERIKTMLEYNPDVKAVLVINPTYQGVVSDIRAIAEVVHGFGLPLLVDEAHGPHLTFSPALPADLFNVLLLITFGNQPPDVDAVLAALDKIVQQVALRRPVEKSYAKIDDINIFPDLPEAVYSPREAFLASTVTVPFAEAAGRVSAEIIACYPPGIPVISPGERITREIIDYLFLMRDLGVHFQGCADKTLEYLQVIG